jgi:hypothetical protein
VTDTPLAPLGARNTSTGVQFPVRNANHVGFTMTWERSRNRKNFAAVSIQQSDRRAKSGRSFAIVV